MLKQLKLGRSTLRGIRKCPQCQHYNGNRAKGCSNKSCRLSTNKKEWKNGKCSFDCVQLISHSDTKIFSVRSKDRDPNVRSFVQITDVVLSSDEEGSIINRNAICFVDTCKYDCNDLSISCKHVKYALECSKVAEELDFTNDSLNNLNISDHRKASLWNLYAKDESLVPPVQRINKTTFAIKCSASANFPAGRLHVTVIPDDLTDFSFQCACKKLRILLSPNNSIVLESETCDHLLILLASLVTTKTFRTEYKKFVEAMSSFWVSDSFVEIFNTNLLTTEDFISFSESILNSCEDFAGSSNINDTRILENVSNLSSGKQSCAIEGETELVTIPISNPEEENLTNYENGNLELAECQIELMDQFKLTNQIDLCNDDIDLPQTEVLHPACQDDINIAPILNDVVVENLKGALVSENSGSVNQTKLSQKSKTAEKCKREVKSSYNLEFRNWLEFVIEKLNSTLDFDATERCIVNVFEITNDFFALLSRKFCFGEKRRLPNNTTMIKNGKHKGLTSFKWALTTPSLVKKIFSTDMVKIQLEKEFFQKSPGKFEPYTRESISQSCSSSRKLKRILPTIYKVYMLIGKNEGIFLIEWIPDVYRQSRFGLLRIQYTIGFKKNNEIIELLPT